MELVELFPSQERVAEGVGVGILEFGSGGETSPEHTNFHPVFLRERLNCFAYMVGSVFAIWSCAHGEDDLLEAVFRKLLKSREELFLADDGARVFLENGEGSAKDEVLTPIRFASLNAFQIRIFFDNKER